MREFSREEVKIIQQFILEAEQGDEMDIEEFFREIKQEEFDYLNHLEKYKILIRK